VTRIFLADDHDVVRRGLRQLLETRADWNVCGEATNGREAVAMAIELAPDVAVLDVAMPELNGIEATRRLRKELPNTEVLVYSMHDADHFVHDALAAGARGYVLKSDAAEILVAAVESLSMRRPFLSSAVTQSVLDRYLRANERADEAAPPATRLTSREREIVQLLAEGWGYKEVATALSISPKTVETHRTVIMRKLGFHSFAELVRYAVRNGIVQA
jgi:DNA-binding NarL/FixJ family response regulator